MKDSQQTGQLGEAIAEGYLHQRGFTIVESSYRYRRAEIDLIALKDETYYFIEVKTRRGLGHGHPTVAFTDAKKKLLAKAAAHFMYTANHEGAFRFDVISIVLHPNGQYDLEHLEDAFFPGLH
ncbi:YraN family protein [Lewinella sp. 4G2]|uniref:YraN family protein n=1 Tax=Lewinella sp. 4G2 TaxID=1803372 RepID=UPI0007B4A839|nr:YraN family protein [Lewinella sp. 4G2]OAV42807.1 hypothetical protein A3850_016365 [Lewinella sp. 4G2]